MRKYEVVRNVDFFLNVNNVSEIAKTVADVDNVEDVKMAVMNKFIEDGKTGKVVQLEGNSIKFKFYFWNYDEKEDGTNFYIAVNKLKGEKEFADVEKILNDTVNDSADWLSVLRLDVLREDNLLCMTSEFESALSKKVRAVRKYIYKNR